MSPSLSAAFRLRFLSFLGLHRDSRVYAAFIFRVNRSTINRRLTKGDGRRADTRRKKSDEVDLVGTWKLSRDRTWQASQKNANSTTKKNKSLLENFARKSQTIAKWLKNNDTRYVSLAHLRQQVRETHVCLHARAPFHIFLSPVIVFLSFTSTFFFFACSLVLFFSFILVCIRSKPSVSFSFLSFYRFSSSGSPRVSASFTKKGARREARGEKRYYFFFYKYRDRVPCDRHRPRSLSKKNCSRTQRNGSRAAPTSSGFLSRRLRGWPRGHAGCTASSGPIGGPRAP